MTAYDATGNLKAVYERQPEEHALTWIFVYAGGALITLIYLIIIAAQSALHWWEWPWRLLLDLVRADLWPVYWLFLR